MKKKYTQKRKGALGSQLTFAANCVTYDVVHSLGSGRMSASLSQPHYGTIHAISPVFPDPEDGDRM
jgi:hypothetical protein